MILIALSSINPTQEDEKKHSISFNQNDKELMICFEQNTISNFNKIEEFKFNLENIIRAAMKCL